MKEAILVLGPESSGTRLLTRLFIDAGCHGDDGAEQRWDDQPPQDETPVVWRRSVPHRQEWPDLAGMIGTLLSCKYYPRAAVIVRDWHPTRLSQQQRGHVRNGNHAQGRMEKALPYIFTRLMATSTPYVVTTYEALVLHPQESSAALMDWFGLPAPVANEIFDGNAKHY